MSEMTMEQKRLDEVCGYINSLLSKSGTDILELKEYIKEERARIWDDYMHTAPDVEDAQGIQQITQTEMRDVMRYERMREQNESLLLLADNPYFARLDVKDEYGEDSIYIGKRSLMDKSGYDMLVCDWRSDIASLFYDSDLGKAHYETEQGRVECELKLRRQFRIADGKILYMFDSDIAIEDDILKEELGKSDSSKLKTIVSTIQREQSVIIRDISADLVLVEGVAGSGKTSIALHRMAYLLYKFRKTLTSGNIVIFSLNNIFTSYITSVLPDLGEDRAVQTGFYDFFRQYFREYSIEDGTAQAEAVFENDEYLKEILLKGGEPFRKVLEDTFTDSIKVGVHPCDITIFGNKLRTKEEIEYLYFTDYASYSPDIRRKKIKDGIMAFLTEQSGILEEHRKIYERELTEHNIAYTDEELEAAVNERWKSDISDVERSIDASLTMDVLSVYFKALEKVSPDLCEKTRLYFSRKEMKYEDMAALVYLKILTGQIPVQSRIRQLLLDEAQDYSPVMFAVFGLLYPDARYTVVGDTAQAFIRYFDDLKTVAKYFVKKRSEHMFRLDKSYRSTAEINAYLRDKFGASNAFFERHGEPVNEIPADSLTEYLKSEDRTGRSVAIICKTAKEGVSLRSKLLKSGIDLHLMNSRDVLMPEKTVIIPSHLTKGLEFDEVIIADGTDKNWSSESERRALYVSESRALHRLTVCV